MTHKLWIVHVRHPTLGPVADTLLIDTRATDADAMQHARAVQAEGRVLAGDIFDLHPQGAPSFAERLAVAQSDSALWRFLSHELAYGTRYTRHPRWAPPPSSAEHADMMGVLRPLVLSDPAFRPFIAGCPVGGPTGRWFAEDVVREIVARIFAAPRPESFELSHL